MYRYGVKCLVAILALDLFLSHAPFSICANLARGKDGILTNVGNDIQVGAVNMYVQASRKRVVFQTVRGASASTLAQSMLIGDVIEYSPYTRIIRIKVAIRNTGMVSLMAPFQLVARKLTPPQISTLVDGQPTYGQVSWQASAGNCGILPPGSNSEPAILSFCLPYLLDFQVYLNITAGVPVPSNFDGTITAEDGATLIVKPGALPYEALLDIRSAPISSITAPVGQLEPFHVISLQITPAVIGAISIAPLQESFELSIPAPENVPSNRWLVAKQINAVNLSSGPDVSPQLALADTALYAGGEIATDERSDSLGIRSGGLYIFIPDYGSGYIRGTVYEDARARSGVVISNTSNYLVAVSDRLGHYITYVHDNAFGLNAFDPFRGSRASAVGNLLSSGDELTLNLYMSTPESSENKLDGIRNGGFEMGQLSSFWAKTGSAQVAEQLGPSSTGVIIRPTEGNWMADINTGVNASGQIGSSIKQRFKVPAGVSSLSVDFNFISEEFPEFVNSAYDDSFRAVITVLDDNNPLTTFANVSVNDSGGYSLIGDMFFPGGDRTCGMTGWRTGNVDLSAYAGTGSTIEVELLFSAIDAGDTIYDTHVLIDNIRFGTLWIDAKWHEDWSSDPSYFIEEQVRNANEILSQVGLNIQIRDISMLNDPQQVFAFIDESTRECRTRGVFNCKWVAPADAMQLLSTNRSQASSDLNVYFITDFIHTGNFNVMGSTYTEEDYFDITTMQNAGVLVGQHGMGDGLVLAHEFVHILIAPDRAGDALEHGVADGAGNLMASEYDEANRLLTRIQSANINRIGAPLIIR